MSRIARVLSCVMLLAGGVPHAQPAEPRLEVLSPAEDEHVSGMVLLSARIEPSTVAVQSVQFFANATLACMLDRPPFECQWDAGPSVREHHIRVVAVLSDGRRLIHSFRTKTRPTAPFRSAVEGVQITAIVKDRRGRFVSDLRPADFQIREDGIRQEITYFAAKDDALEVVVAVDISGSMAGAMRELKAAVMAFLATLRPVDSVTLLGFNDNVFIVAGPDTDAETRRRRVNQLEAWGGTSLYDAILKSLDMVRPESGRKAVVVFTDGDDRSSRATRDLTEHRLKIGRAVLYAVGMGRGAVAATLMTELDGLSRVTGGRGFIVRNTKDLETAFRQIAEEVTHHYVLGYTPAAPPESGGWRRIAVEVLGRRHQVTVRDGYLAERATAGP